MRPGLRRKEERVHLGVWIEGRGCRGVGQMVCIICEHARPLHKMVGGATRDGGS